eukprot:5666456-Pyramimonas_sp.AAC.1
MLRVFGEGCGNAQKAGGGPADGRATAACLLGIAASPTPRPGTFLGGAGSREPLSASGRWR